MWETSERGIDCKGSEAMKTLTLKDIYESVLNDYTRCADKRIKKYGSWLRRNDPDKFKLGFIDFIN
jgi:hypothetical protein